MFDRYDAGEQAVLVHIYFSQDKDMEDLQEFETLASSAGVEAMQVITGSRKAPHPKYFVGEGKAVEIAEAVKATGASVVLFDHALSPAQERNLERLCECRVIDRTGLILDIFAQRARTHEGKLQVELAQYQYINGVIRYLDVLDAQREYFDAQTGLSNAVRDEQIALVQLYKALGGGWNPEDDPQEKGQKS